MVSITHYLSRNRFALICSILCAFVALVYIAVFREHLLYKVYWELFAVISSFTITLLFQKRIESINPRKTRVTAKTIYLSLITSLCVFIVYPLVIVIAYPPPNEVNRHSICCETPLEFGAQHYETVTLTLDDGIKIAGWYIPSTLPKDYLIIMIHGHWNDRRGTLAFARYLIKAGHPIFMYDQRGNGESEGELDFVKNDLSRDLLNIREQLKVKYSVTNFGAVGLSMGAHTVINALHKDNVPFKAVWLDGLMPQSQKDFSLTDDMAENTFFDFFNLHLIRTMEFFYGHSPRRPIVDILSETHSTKVMLVAGGNEKTESNANQKFSKVDNTNIQTWLIPNAGHLTGPFDTPAKYEKRLVEFFDSM
jgi:predicted acyl esterase